MSEDKEELRYLDGGPEDLLDDPRVQLALKQQGFQDVDDIVTAFGENMGASIDQIIRDSFRLGTRVQYKGRPDVLGTVVDGDKPSKPGVIWVKWDDHEVGPWFDGPFIAGYDYDQLELASETG